MDEVQENMEEQQNNIQTGNNNITNGNNTSDNLSSSTGTNKKRGSDDIIFEDTSWTDDESVPEILQAERECLDELLLEKY